MRRDSFNEDAIHFAPFALLPSPFPSNEFQRAVELQPVLNCLMCKVANDTEFLKDTLKATIEVDDFTRRLYDIMATVNSEGLAQVRLYTDANYIILKLKNTGI